MEPRKLSLDEQLCFALYAATNAVTRAYRPLLEQVGLTYPQYIVMLVLWQDGPATIGRIASRLMLQPHAVSPMIERLEGAGLVRREAVPGDRRAVRIVLTEAGEALEAPVSIAQQTVVCETTLSPAELQSLRDDLKSLVARMESPDNPD
jgi:DNA-binding MarR family transcriptional regulator